MLPLQSCRDIIITLRCAVSNDSSSNVAQCWTPQLAVQITTSTPLMASSKLEWAQLELDRIGVHLSSVWNCFSNVHWTGRNSENNSKPHRHIVRSPTGNDRLLLIDKKNSAARAFKPGSWCWLVFLKFTMNPQQNFTTTMFECVEGRWSTCWTCLPTDEKSRF